MKIGLITYHSAYNFGSVLQAFSTQNFIEKLGHQVKIINYRPVSQKRFYAIINTGNGTKSFIKTLLRLPNLKGLLLRKQRYETFIHDYLHLTDEFETPDDARQYAEAFDLYVSGSDQVWNKNSNELKSVSWDYMNPYLLTFTKRKKISYASSLNDMHAEDILNIVEPLQEFQYISCRESVACDLLSDYIDKKIWNVLDPTLLIPGDTWLKMIPKERLIKDEFILYYSLRGITDINRDISNLLNCQSSKIAVIAPLSPVRPSGKIINMDSAGPIEFLQLILDAKCIVTTSYHGTLFSINLHKNFFSVRGKNKNSNIRFEDVLYKTGLYDRLITSTSDITESAIDYTDVDQVLEQYREASVEYLKRAIGD